jgi:hypothetical protein
MGKEAALDQQGAVKVMEISTNTIKIRPIVQLQYNQTTTFQLFLTEQASFCFHD